jgi:cytochrome c oxidase subunit IV
VNDRLKDFGGIAQGLARNPLGIIALFIVLVYGFASLVTAFSGSLTPTERMPLIYFMVLFPVLVLGVFAWLVSSHSGKLFAPADFKNEENYVRMQLSAAASLATAAAKNQNDASADIAGIVEAVQLAAPRNNARGDGWRNQILWVDDIPDNNIHERRAFEAFGLGRREGPREGYALLDTLRKRGDATPFFIYASSNAPEHKRETAMHDGQGCTNNAQDLFEMVTRAVIASGTRAVRA